MPIVSERQAPSSQKLSLMQWDGRPLIVTVPSGPSKTQSGYRSGPLSQAQLKSIDGSMKSTWANSLRIVQGYDYEYNTRENRLAGVVNQRDYTEQCNIVSGTCPWTTFSGAPYNTTRSGITAISIAGAVPAGGPSMADLTSNASDMMRQSVPTAPAIDLVRSLGELRDLPKSLHPGNYAPRSARDVGGGYLNMVFGLNPTGKDIAAIANAALASHPIVDRFVQYERRQLRRRRTRSLSSVNFTTVLTPDGAGSSSTTLYGPGSSIWGSVTNWAPAFGRDVNFDNTRPWLVTANVRATGEIRQFATYEYFIPRPTGLMGRMDLYRQKAEQVLGSGLSPAAVYELTPWTWMLDWFLDIGGLIRYQQSVAANSVVASRSGWVYENSATFEASMSPASSIRYFADAKLGSPPYIIGTAKTQIRRAGGPYGISQPWSLSGGQAAIVTALAMSRYSPF